jgi:carboxypeptidase family protein
MRATRIQASAVAMIFLSLILSTASKASALAAPQQTGRIRGVVLDPNDARIVGATIKIESETLKRTIHTDDAGEFEVKVPIGSYQLCAQGGGFNNSENKVLRVREDGISSISFRLFPGASPIILEPPWGDVRIEPQNAPLELSRKIEKRKLQ